MATTRASSYVKTTVAFKPASIKAAIKPPAPVTYKPPKPDPAALARLVKVSLGTPAGIRAKTAPKR
jgi:hypothetical protein